MNEIKRINDEMSLSDLKSEPKNLEAIIEDAMNSNQEDQVIKADLKNFNLRDNNEGYLLVSHIDLNNSVLGKIGINEYSTSKDKSALLQNIVNDSMTRVASEGTFAINFTGSFVEPKIEKMAGEGEVKKCPECDKPNQFGEMCSKCEEEFNRVMSFKESSKKSWLTADLDVEMHDMDEPSEEDVMIVSEGPLGSQTVAYQNGKQLAKLENDDWDKFYLEIKQAQGPNFFPSVWVVSDHGNMYLDSGWSDFVNSHQEKESSIKEYCAGCGLPWDNSKNYDGCHECGCVTIEKKNEKESSINIKQEPLAHQSSKLAYDMQAEETNKVVADNKLKDEASNAVVSMLQTMGYGSSRVAEINVSNNSLDIMTTLDDFGTLKAVNIPVTIKEGKIELPKKNLISELINKGLDINKKVSEDFALEVLAQMDSIEAKEQFFSDEIQAILNENPNVMIKEASGYDNTQFLGDQDIMEVQKHLLPDHEKLKKGDKVSDGNSQWEIVDTEGHQNDKNEGSSSIWKLKKCAPPKSDEKEPKTKLSI